MQGPPAEAVGLDPYPVAGGPGAPGAGARSGPVDLALGTRIPIGKGSS